MDLNQTAQGMVMGSAGARHGQKANARAHTAAALAMSPP